MRRGKESEADRLVSASLTYGSLTVRAVVALPPAKRQTEVWLELVGYRYGNQERALTPDTAGVAPRALLHGRLARRVFVSAREI